MPTFEPYFPQIVDPSGVTASTDARPLAKTTDDSRAAMVEETGGTPMVDFEGTSNPYIDYQSIDLLLSLQHPRSSGYDEMCFFVMGQVKELLFRGVHLELVNAQMQIRDDEVGNALQILDRAKTFLHDTRAHDELHRLGEALISLDQQFSIYRWRHFISVERIIGYKPGTGGSAGVGWLEQITKHHFFPELWAISG